MHAPDLSQYNYYLPFVLDDIYFVGWLDSHRPFPTGDVPLPICNKLWQIIEKREPALNFHVNKVRGIHTCNLCHLEITLTGLAGTKITLGMSEVWIPGQNVWYACPSLVYHYITSHRYLPPQVFLDAVESCSLEERVVSQEQYDIAIRDAQDLSSR